MNPTYSFTEAMELIILCDTKEELTIIDDLIIEERKLYALNELKAMQTVLSLAYNALYQHK